MRIYERDLYMKYSEGRHGQELDDVRPIVDIVDPVPPATSSPHGQKSLDVNAPILVKSDHDFGHQVPAISHLSTMGSNEVEVTVKDPLSKPHGADLLQWKSSDRRDLNLPSLLPVGVLRRDLDSSSYLYEQKISLLESHGWIQSEVSNCTNYIRVYVNPMMTSRRNTQRSSTRLRAALRSIMAKIESSPETWINPRLSEKAEDLQSVDTVDESLWYIFNTLKDPCPRPGEIKDYWSRRAMEQLLFNDELSELGLRTTLYPYQRRSAATMVQREAQPSQMLDPRMQPCQSPDGRKYWYDREDAYITLNKVLYSEACGGILAETMGCGKTLICLAVICATRGHTPEIPIEYMSTPEKPDLTYVRESTGSLLDMAAAAAQRHSEPWRTFFRDREREGLYFERCKRACEYHQASYEIPPHRTRYQGRQNQSFPRPPAKRVFLCAGTIIIVPNNLLDHWQREIKTHTEGLNVLVFDQRSGDLPSAEHLMSYDIVLFAKTRFEREAGESINNRRGRFVQMDSPLTELHWLRVIVDEGHNVAGQGSRTNTIHLLSQLHFERRWVISGTPSAGLYGVEVSLASRELNASDTDSATDLTAAALQSRRKTGNAVTNELKDLDRLRRIVVEFLGLKPWANSRADDDYADWSKYIKPIGEDGRRRKTAAIRATLQGLVVRHQLNVVSQEIYIPKLYNEVVYLEPTFHDRLSINLFLFGLAVNAITSERQGPDYIFDPRNRKHLNQTINNLRQAGFWWAGSEVSPQDSIEHATRYMDKNRESMTAEDVDQLIRGIEIARTAMRSSSWREFKRLHELGVYINNFPSEYRAYWSLDQSGADQEPLLVGITQARRAQQFVARHLKLSDPTQGLAGAGITTRHDLERRDQQTPPKGAPESAHNLNTASTPAPASTPGSLHHNPKPQTNKSPAKTFTRNLFYSLPANSPLQKTQLVATASAKLTYLLNKVLQLQDTEKIIIFYDNNNSAFWIAEGLELLGVEFRIYASTLKPELRTEYLKLFREAEDVRVLLMDLRQASHGLHIAQASRIFIVNPIWQPNVESQAIKRAHRIGQKNPVYVETLVLRDTLEDHMLKRRREMSEAEIQHAEKSLLDDGTMSDIVQREPFLPMGQEEEDDTAAAFLDHPVGFFNRHRLPIPDDEDLTLVTSKTDLSTETGKRVFGARDSVADDSQSALGNDDEPACKRMRVDVLPERDNSPLEMEGEGTKRSIFGGPDHSSSGDCAVDGLVLSNRKPRVGFSS